MMITILQTGMDYSTAQQTGIGAGAIIFYILIFAFYGYCMYKLFQKAGIENAWMGFIPIVGLIPLIQIAKKPVWWLVLTFIPLVGLIIMIIIWMRVAKAFGKSDLFGIAMIFLGFILLPVLAFGSAQYHPNAIPDESH